MQQRHGWVLLAVTVLLVLVGCVLYLNDAVGWAQLFWVFGSGTAGASIIALFDD